MSTLPFKLRKYHKYSSRQNWEKRGLIFVDDAHFGSVYNAYIHATNCYNIYSMLENIKKKNSKYPNIHIYIGHILRTPNKYNKILQC